MKWTAVALLPLSLAALAVAKPARILFPQLAGVECPVNGICIDNPESFPAAMELYNRALSDVRQKLGTYSSRPRVVFCSAQTGFERFGFNRRAAATVGIFGTVIGPRGWELHYLRHDMIHYWQFQNLGMIRTWLAPEWLTEGMAYSLSGDPRENLSESFQSYRLRFDRWRQQEAGEDLIAALKQKLRRSD